MKKMPLSFSRHVQDALVARNTYIDDLAKMHGPLVHAEEVAQLVRLKLATALETKDVHDINAYLKAMIRNEWASFFRNQKRKLVLSPLVFTDGELQHGYWLSGLRLNDGSGDPQVILDEAAGFYWRLGQVVRAIIHLPPTQKRVAICVLRDRIDYPHLLTEAFKHYGVDCSQYQWPVDPKEKQTLQASYTPVRQKLSLLMGVDLNEFKKHSCKSQVLL